jgi:hypothetical protein
MLHKNVTPRTTGSSPEHNGVPSATNVQRLAEIRARLAGLREPRYPTPPAQMLADDIAWLLDEVCRLMAKYQTTDVVTVPCDCHDCKRLAMRIGLAEAADA